MSGRESRHTDQSARSLDEITIPKWAARGKEEAPTTGGEDPSVVARNARGGDVSRSAKGHRWHPSFRARQALEERSGSPLENALQLFHRAEIMGEILQETGTSSPELFVVAREDIPGSEGIGFSSIMLVWVPGDGFGLMTWDDGESHLLETYHSPEELAEGRAPYRLLVAATRNMLADDAGARLVRLQENSRRLQQWEREGADRPGHTAPLESP